MKYPSKIFILILIACSTGCAKLKILLYDVRPAEMQTPDRLRDFIVEKRIDSSNIFMLKDPYILKSLNESINRAFLYDKNGISIKYDAGKENKRCLGNIESYLLNYQRNDSVSLDSVHTFEMEWNHWETLRGELPDSPPAGGDLTLVYYWNAFSGNTNHRDFFKEIEKIIRERPDLEIVFYKVNQDLREGMDLEKYTIELLNLNDTLMKPAEH